MKAIKKVLRYVKGTKDYGITYKHNGATAAVTQALWLKRLLSRLTHSDEEKITILVDNKSAITLMKNPVFHERSKHIDTKYYFIRECVERDDIQVKEYQEKDKIRSKPDKNEKRGEAEKSQKQLQ
nr:ribonuclease H-like domain, reverse transcriptase, RNA-dependent DNA polymerase [Tanacetum cinerariifolium]